MHVWAMQVHCHTMPHHTMQGKARCTSVRAVASEGVVAERMLGRPCEDTITLTAEWENCPATEGAKTTKGEGSGFGLIYDGVYLLLCFKASHSPPPGHATYTASWTAAKADVHSQQRFFCLMEQGEVAAASRSSCHPGDRGPVPPRLHPRQRRVPGPHVPQPPLHQVSTLQGIT